MGAIAPVGSTDTTAEIGSFLRSLPKEQTNAGSSEFSKDEVGNFALLVITGGQFYRAHRRRLKECAMQKSSKQILYFYESKAFFGKIARIL